MMTYPECLDSDGDVVPLPDGLVHVPVLAAAQLVLHHNVRPEEESRIKFHRFYAQRLRC